MAVPGVVVDLVLVLLERVLDAPEVVPVVLLTQVLDILDVVLIHDGVEALGPTNSHRSFVVGGGSARRRMELQRQ